jgi:hypothetical protein
MPQDMDTATLPDSLRCGLAVVLAVLHAQSAGKPTDLEAP